MPRRFTTRFALLSLAVLAVSIAGCGRGASTEADQPTAPDGAFVAGEFAALPKPDGALPLADPAVDGRTTAQSFRVVGSGVEAIVGFYQVRLPMVGWEPRMPPAEVGDGDWQGVWDRGDQTLEVSVTAENDNATVTSQLDLVLTR